VIFGSSITSTVIVVFLLNLFFNHWKAWPPKSTALRVALGYGAVAGVTDRDLAAHGVTATATTAGETTGTAATRTAATGTAATGTAATRTAATAGETEAPPPGFAPAPRPQTSP
jgi:hypothetical protein